jgi:hypothetical protein
VCVYIHILCLCLCLCLCLYHHSALPCSRQIGLSRKCCSVSQLAEVFLASACRSFYRRRCGRRQGIITPQPMRQRLVFAHVCGATLLPEGLTVSLVHTHTHTHTHTYTHTHTSVHITIMNLLSGMPCFRKASKQFANLVAVAFRHPGIPKFMP